MAAAEANAAAAAAAASGNDNEARECFSLDEWVEYFKFQRGRDSPGEARNGLLVIAVLITTATYQAVLSPPGGLWQDNKNGKAGKTILGTNSINFGFGVFLISNTAGFFGSLFIIEILTEGFPLRLELWFITFALIISYDSAMIGIIPYGRFSILFTVLSICLPLVIAMVARVVRRIGILSNRCCCCSLRKGRKGQCCCCCSCSLRKGRKGQGHHSRVSTPLQVMESSGP